MARKPKQVRAQPKKAKKARKPPATMGGAANASFARTMAMQACAATNPFCPEAVGYRWPDNSYTKSVGYSVTDFQMTPMATNAAGSAARLFGVDGVGLYMDGTVAGSTITWPVTWSNITSVPSNISRYRSTSFGLKISCLANAMTVQGMLRVRFMSNETGSSIGTSGSTTTNLCDFAYDVPLSRLVGKDLFLISMPLGINARTFYPGSSVTVASWDNPGWQLIQVAVDGGPISTSCVNISVFSHSEQVYAIGSANAAFTVAAPKDNPVVRGANAGLLQSIGNTVEGAAQSIDNLFKSKAMKLLGGVAGAILTKSPQGALAGYQAMAIADVD